MVWREDDRKEILKPLLDTNIVENVSIIPIIGVGGLGKTTLAQFVYNNEKIKTYFELKLWICVSDNVDVKQIVKQILESLKVERHEENLENLQNHLRKKLNGKIYLLVLDNVWNENKEKWLLLKNLQMGDVWGAWIIITTRFVKAAYITGTTSPHALKGLAPEKPWSLFVKMAFKEGKKPENQALVALGKQNFRFSNGW